jgi:hypothetical protein
MRAWCAAFDVDFHRARERFVECERRVGTPHGLVHAAPRGRGRRSWRTCVKALGFLLGQRLEGRPPALPALPRVG